MSWFQRRIELSRSVGAADVADQSGKRPVRIRWIAVIVFLIASALGYPRCRLWWQIHSGHQALVTGRPEVALGYLAKAVQDAPDSAEAQYRLAVAERRCGHLDRVASQLQRAKMLGWSNEDLERQKLLTLAQSGEIDTVDSPLKAIMRRGASDEAAEEIYEALLIGYLKSYRLKDAWECLSFWSKWQPRAIFPKLCKADIYRRQNRGEQEEQEYREILAMAPETLRARRRLAEICKESNRVDEAIREYEKCLAGSDDSVETLLGLAECRRRSGDNVAAGLLLNRAVTMTLSNRQRASVLSQLGQIAADGGDWKHASQYLEESVRLFPCEVATLFALSQTYSSLGEAEKARTLGERLKTVQSQLNQIDKLVSEIAEKPMDAGLRYEIGTKMIELGMKDEGVAWVRSALQVHPNFEPAVRALSVLDASPDSKNPLKQ